MSTLSVETIKSLAEATPPVVQDSAGTQIGTFCRAWVNFNGTANVSPATTPATNVIRASFNVSSVTDNAVGDYTVNFTNSMPDASYSFSGCVYQSGAVNPKVWSPSVAPTAAALRIFTGNSGGTISDATDVSVAIFR